MVCDFRKRDALRKRDTSHVLVNGKNIGHIIIPDVLPSGNILVGGRPPSKTHGMVVPTPARKHIRAGVFYEVWEK